MHPEDKGCGSAEDWAHAYEKIPYVLVEAFLIPAVINVSKDSVLCFVVKELEFTYSVPEYVAHQQVTEFVDRGAYPRCNHNSFPSEDPLEIKVGSALNNAEYHANKDQGACDTESFEKA